MAVGPQGAGVQRRRGRAAGDERGRVIVVGGLVGDLSGGAPRGGGGRSGDALGGGDWVGRARGWTECLRQDRRRSASAGREAGPIFLRGALRGEFLIARLVGRHEMKRIHFRIYRAWIGERVTKALQDRRESG
jgi:hypothetical protein